ncbi:microtubule-associated proteins 1A/1B light chain 3B-like [Argiope bruennichi]|uniref:Microtubule-associated proteins 1A/1B light like protein n=1 Tax=Argiope bruennichi TaxID=94029 RepID=A0A8T0EHY2_ARGBR|nr:microtubule-associated proteins 1A/1B light chain 3B-like [Argiope bruennichi]KAF8771274.1 Microtubule-associated proteins 1A/1B light like protein [Argiope bruennichi]
MSFQEEMSESRRRETVKLLMKKAPDRVPVVITRMSSASNLPPLKPSKFLLRNDMLAIHLFNLIRCKLNLMPEESIYLTTNGIMISPSMHICELYKEGHDEDGILYIKYGSENVFG